MPEQRNHIWQFGLLDRFALSFILLTMGAAQVAVLEAVLREHGASSAAAINEATSTVMLGLLLGVGVLTFGGPMIRGGAAKIAPRVRAGLGE